MRVFLKFTSFLKLPYMWSSYFVFVFFHICEMLPCISAFEFVLIMYFCHNQVPFKRDLSIVQNPFKTEDKILSLKHLCQSFPVFSFYLHLGVKRQLIHVLLKKKNNLVI